MSSSNGVVLVVRGLRGFLRGEERRLAVGESMVIGRSRKVDFSTRRAPRLKARPDAAKVIGTPAFLTVSRRHTLLHHVAPGVVEITDLSSNGTYVDGRKIERERLEDLATKNHILSIGAQERLELALESAKKSAG